MERYIGKFSEEAYALMRIIVGALFACHGAQKLFGLFHGPGEPTNPVRLASLVGAAGIIELVCGVLIAVGLAAGYAAFLASGTMAVAYFKAHAPQGFLPIVNKGELAVVYCFLFLYIATRGSGTWSVDSAIKR